MLFCKSLSIDLVEPVVYLHGAKDKHNINILRGVIRLQLKRSLHMDSVTIQFIGISKTLWPEASEHWDKQVLVDTLIPICSTPMLLKKGSHAFPFEILLSNALSESIECGLGHVRYKLICQVNTQPPHWRTSSPLRLPPLINSSLQAKQSVILVRLPPVDTPRCITQTHHVTPHDQLNMVVESAHLTPGALLPVSLFFSRPESIQSLDSLSVKLIERQKFRAPSKQTTRILHHEITLQQSSKQDKQQQQQQDEEDNKDDSWVVDKNETRFVYLVPDSRSLQVHPTTTNRIIRVRHWIQVALTLTLVNGDTKDIWMDTPISVLLSSLDDYHTLPVYQCDPTIQQATPPPSPTTTTTRRSSSSSTSSTSTYSSNSTTSSNTTTLIKGGDYKKKSSSSFSIMIEPPPPQPTGFTTTTNKKRLKPSTWISKLYARHREVLGLPPPTSSLPPSPPSPPTSSSRSSSFDSTSSSSAPPTYQEHVDHHHHHHHPFSSSILPAHMET
ncbi:hypothetical protein BC941DRAFT_139667 [Chlamydoabsidia padenii]|nr:hypothetical protein BC941DRAFT_139667 [Chlamydoabsidia padenii]